MILVDDRAGSNTLITPLIKAGLPVEVTRLDAGDVAFVGRGEQGAPVNIGIEHKVVADAVQSLRTGRLAGHQLLGMQEMYDYSYLLIEGEVMFTADGQLLRRTGRRAFKPIGMSVDELYKRLGVLHLRGGLITVFMPTRRETVRWISAWYHLWTDTDLDKHKSHLAIYRPPTLRKPTVFEDVIRAAPGVGMQVAAAAQKAFGSIKRAVNASEKEWAEIETADAKGKRRRFGTSAASKVVGAFTSDYRE